LREMQPFGGAGEAARFLHRNEGAQQGRIDVHGSYVHDGN